MKTTKKIALTGILAALYFVLSMSLKIPFIGNISLDLGYLVLTVAAVTLGALPAALVGAIGAAVESILLSPYGLSIGWVTMNFIVGFIVGSVFYGVELDTRDWHDWVCYGIIILEAVFLGVAAKTIIECVLYSIPLVIKIPKSAVACVIDSIVMICGLPLAEIVQKKTRNIFIKRG